MCRLTKIEEDSLVKLMAKYNALYDELMFKILVNHTIIVKKRVLIDCSKPYIIFQCWNCHKLVPSYRTRKRCKCGKLNIF